MAGRVYHWKHGWIPLDHAAAKKKYGSAEAAEAHGFSPVSHGDLPRKGHIAATFNTSTKQFTIRDQQRGTSVQISTERASALQSSGQSITSVTSSGSVRTTRSVSTPTQVVDTPTQTRPKFQAPEIPEWLRKKDDTGSAKPESKVPKFQSLEQTYGKNVHGVGTNRIHERDLAMFSDEVHATLAEHFKSGRGRHAGIHIGGRGTYVTDLDGMKNLKGQTPRGWPPGSSWDQVPGLYSPSDRAVIMGDNVDHGSVSLALHESSHALDDALGTPSMTRQFKEVHREFEQSVPMSPYFSRAGNPTGAESETFAEGFATYTKYKDRTPQEQETAMIQALAGGLQPAGRAPARRLIDYFSGLEASMRDKYSSQVA